MFFHLFKDVRDNFSPPHCSEKKQKKGVAGRGSGKLLIWNRVQADHRNGKDEVHVKAFLFTDGTLGAFWCFSWEKCQWCLLDRAALEGQCYSAQRKTEKEEKGDRERETGKSYGESSKGMEGGVRQVIEIVMQNLQEPYREGEAQAGQNGPSYAIRRLHACIPISFPMQYLCFALILTFLRAISFVFLLYNSQIISFCCFHQLLLHVSTVLFVYNSLYC